MKKLLALLVLSVSLIGCGSSENTEIKQTENTAEQSNTVSYIKDGKLVTESILSNTYYDISRNNEYLTLAGADVTVPCKFKDLDNIKLVLDDYTIDEGKNDSLEPNSGTWIDFSTQLDNSLNISLRIENNTAELKHYSDCDVASIVVEFNHTINLGDLNTESVDDKIVLGETTNELVFNEDDTYEDYTLGIHEFNHTITVRRKEGKINYIRLEHNSENYDTLFFLRDARNLDDIQAKLQGWHLQEPEELSITTVAIDSTWKDGFYINDTFYSFGTKARNFPYLGFNEDLEAMCSLVKSKAAILGDAFTDALLDGTEDTEAVLKFRLDEKFGEDVTYYGDYTIDGIDLDGYSFDNTAYSYKNDKVTIGVSDDLVFELLGDDCTIDRIIDTVSLITYNNGNMVLEIKIQCELDSDSQPDGNYYVSGITIRKL